MEEERINGFHSTEFDNGKGLDTPSDATVPPAPSGKEEKSGKEGD